MKLDPRARIADRPQPQGPALARFVCPRCAHESATRYRFTFAVCPCGWLIKIEPAPKYGKLDDHGRTDTSYAPINIDEVRQVAPPGWEDAKDWNRSGGDPIRRACQACGRLTYQDHRHPPDGSRFHVTTCQKCGTAHPDQKELRAGINSVIGVWRQQGKAKEVPAADGKPRGVILPSHAEVEEEADLRAMLEKQQEERG